LTTITGNGSVQAPVAERPVALPPVTAKEHAIMPAQLSLSAEAAELRASIHKSLSGLRKIHCDLMDTIAKSRATIADSAALIATVNKALPPPEPAPKLLPK
jgi:hypothetical protein